MDALAKLVLDASASFPIFIQAAFVGLILLGGIYMMTRGNQDNATKPPELIPQWILIGPLHDMMQSVHEVAEEARRSNDLLREFKDLQNDILREMQHARQTLELIRNESRMR
jgi:hypothetical protein